MICTISATYDSSICQMFTITIKLSMEPEFLNHRHHCISPKVYVLDQCIPLISSFIICKKLQKILIIPFDLDKVGTRLRATANEGNIC